MSDRVVLHIGTMKSGTTYLQSVLTSGALEEVGGFYPGGRFGIQTRAVVRLQGPPKQRRPELWQALAAEAGERSGVAVYSQEFLSFLRRSKVEQVVGSFGGTPVEMILTVRDQRAAVPAQWQSFVRNGGTADLAAYVRRLGTRDKPRRAHKAGRTYWLAQNVPGILGRWAGHDGVVSRTVVVVPPAGAPPAELWRRFCDAAGLDAQDPPAAATVPANESLGHASCEVLRRLNPQLRHLPRLRYRRARAELLDALLPLRAEEGRPELDEAGLALAVDLNRAIVEAASTSGVRVVGSLDELPVDPGAPGMVAVAGPDEAQVRRAIGAAWTTVFPGQPFPDGSLDEAAAEMGRRLASRHARRRHGGRRGGRPAGDG